MNIGRMNQRVQIEAQGTTTDPVYGPQPGAWTAIGIVYAEVLDVLPRQAESIVGGIKMESRPARVRMRYRTDITSAMRLVLLDRGNRVMKIMVGPAELGNKDGLEMTVQEFSTAGDAA